MSDVGCPILQKQPRYYLRTVGASISAQINPGPTLSTTTRHRLDHRFTTSAHVTSHVEIQRSEGSNMIELSAPKMQPSPPTHDYFLVLLYPHCKTRSLAYSES